MGIGCYRQYSEEEVNDFVAFVDKWIPTDPKKKPSPESSKDDDKETVRNEEE